MNIEEFNFAEVHSTLYELDKDRSIIANKDFTLSLLPKLPDFETFKAKFDEIVAKNLAKLPTLRGKQHKYSVETGKKSYSQFINFRWADEKDLYITPLDEFISLVHDLVDEGELQWRGNEEEELSIATKNIWIGLCKQYYAGMLLSSHPLTISGILKVWETDRKGDKQGYDYLLEVNFRQETLLIPVGCGSLNHIDTQIFEKGLPIIHDGSHYCEQLPKSKWHVVTMDYLDGYLSRFRKFTPYH
jgi:hypothetical protein